jgi:hypothetical protein
MTATKLATPTIHLNGSDKVTLFEGYRDAHRAVLDAIELVQQTVPNGRDYYPQGNDATGRATDQHHARMRRLYEVRDELEQIAIAIDGAG